MKKQLLLLVMILVYTSIPNSAQTVVNVNGIRFIVENGNAIVGRQNKELSGDIVIPSSIEYEGQSYPVTGIVGPIDTHSYGGMSSISADEAAFQGTAITSITLPATITSISTCAFIKCSKLQKVVLPETVTLLISDRNKSAKYYAVSIGLVFRWMHIIKKHNNPIWCNVHTKCSFQELRLRKL